MSWKTGETIAFIIIVLMVIGGFVWLTHTMEEADRKSVTVMSMTDIGKILSVDFLEDGISIVRTERGDFSVYGHFQTMKDEYAILEQRESGRRFICLQNSDYCKRLSR